jgi:hypothetical protein
MGDGAIQYQYLALGQIKELAIRMHLNVAKNSLNANATGDCDVPECAYLSSCGAT